LAGKLSPGDFRLLQQYRPVADARVAGTSVCNWIKFRRQSQARLTVVGGATVARVRRPLPRKAAVAADMVRLPPVTPNRHAARCQIAGVQSYNSLASPHRSLSQHFSKSAFIGFSLSDYRNLDRHPCYQGHMIAFP
jgi:hypothetical protein